MARRGKGKVSEAQATEPVASETGTVTGKVLVVNDDDGSCELICRLLSGAGHSVGTWPGRPPSG